MKVWLQIFCLALIFLSEIACTVIQPPSFQSPSTEINQQLFKPQIESARKAIKEGALLLDVRTSDEFSQQHVTGAINLPLSNISERIAKTAPNPQAPIVLYCNHGSRAEAAKMKLIKLKYTNVINGGGMSDLLDVESNR